MVAPRRRELFSAASFNFHHYKGQVVVKRHGFRGRPASHGHPKKRNPGTLGPGTNPSRVIKGKKMPGQMGNTQQTVRNLRVERVDAERNLIYVRGAVPGSRNSLVFIRKM